MNDSVADGTSGLLPDSVELAEALLDAASTGTFEAALLQARTSIDGLDDRIDPLDLFRYRVLFFDLAMVSTTDQDLRHETASRLLSNAIDCGGPAWTAVRAAGRLDEIERLALIPDSGVELLELLAYAPDPGLRAFATSTIEAAGLRALESGEDSRSFERLLHAIGATADAYRLEAVRKQRQAASPWQRKEGRADETAPAGRLVAIAGGHAQMRGTAALLLQRHGISIVQIPSSREAVRRERDILGLLQGCEFAMLLVRQITHSTSDQVRKAAERLDIPVIYSNALSATAIERQLLERTR